MEWPLDVSDYLCIIYSITVLYYILFLNINILAQKHFGEILQKYIRQWWFIILYETGLKNLTHYNWVFFLIYKKV